MTQVRTTTVTGAYYDEKRQFLMVEGVVARNIPEFPVVPRPKRNSLAAAFDGLGGNTTLGIHLSVIAPGGEKKGHRHLDEATFYIVSGHGWSELRQGEDVPDQRVDWKAGDVVTIPANAWHKHYNGDPDRPARQLAFKNTRLLRKLFHSRDFVYANDFRFGDRYADEPDFWTARGEGNYGKVKVNYIPDFVDEAVEPDPEAGQAVSVRRFSMGGHRMLDHLLFEIGVGGHVREHLPFAEEGMLILRGHGRTVLRSDDGRQATITWGPGDLLAPPLHVHRQHHQEGDEPVRYLLVRNNFIERALGVKGNLSLDGAWPDRWPGILEADQDMLARAAAGVDRPGGGDPD
ncbi:MAG TPA: cupin domain-containing protein [Candidatus Limnocylindrales bacterium]